MEGAHKNLPGFTDDVARNGMNFCCMNQSCVNVMSASGNYM